MLDISSIWNGKEKRCCRIDISSAELRQNLTCIMRIDLSSSPMFACVMRQLCGSPYRAPSIHRRIAVSAPLGMQEASKTKPLT